jgi:subtilisin family serine protease
VHKTRKAARDRTDIGKVDYLMQVSRYSRRSNRAIALSRHSILRLPVVLSLFLLCCTPLLLRAKAPEKAYPLDSTLLLLRALGGRGDAPARLRSLLDSPKLGVSIRFRRGVLLAGPNLVQMEKELDLEFTRTNGTIARVGTICGARVPLKALDRLASWPGVERVDSTWKPAVAAPLDRSTDEIRADDVWELLDAAGWPVTGRGIVVAVFDTGVDIFHPDLWRTGGTYPWLDVNGNSLFDPGIDAVDLDRNGFADNSERLDFIDSSTAPQSNHVPGTDDSSYQTDMDWLYNDANRNGWRDHGPQDGFAETDPSYGERLFLADDGNRNGMLEVGEVLLGLDTCKVQKTLNAAGVECTRGVDLITNPPDELGHGTHVCSILAGGSVGLRRYVGVAPGANLLVADPYGNDYVTYIPWAESSGAQIMLYEFGSWIQEFMDGSSNLEQMLNAQAEKGIVQVTPAGNLADGQKHAHLILPALFAADLGFYVPYAEGISEAWLSILWRAPEDAVGMRLTAPSGSSVLLPGDNSWLEVDGHHIWSYMERSPRGTTRFDIYVDRGGAEVAGGNWTLRLDNSTNSWLDVHAYISDNFGRWAGGIIFLDHTDAMYTVSAPATADRAITVASYSTRGREAGVPGALSSFSGQGPRIDNQPVLDLAAPGHHDIACASSKDLLGASVGQYAWFGGTSAAAPHVAGAVALLLQSDPGLSPEQVKETLREHARDDAYTGVVPNSSWGWGKVDIGAALSAPPKPTPTPRARTLLPIVLKPASP